MTNSTSLHQAPGAGGHVIVGLLPSVAAARLALESLRLQGVSDEQIGLAMRQAEQPLSTTEEDRPFPHSGRGHPGGCRRRYHWKACRVADSGRLRNHPRSGSPAGRWIAHFLYWEQPVPPSWRQVDSALSLVASSAR